VLVHALQEAAGINGSYDNYTWIMIISHQCSAVFTLKALKDEKMPSSSASRQLGWDKREIRQLQIFLCNPGIST